MSLEAYTGKISDLVDSNPTPTDPKSQGDDHLRGIKYTLKQSFPNFDGPTTQNPGQITPDTVQIGDGPAAENHFWDGSVANQLSLKRGTPEAPGATVMQVVDGVVSFPQTPGGPAFRAVQNVAQTNIPNGVESKILFETESFDTNNNFSSSRFTPTVAGYYQINASIRMIPVGTSSNWASLIKNGVSYSQGVRIEKTTAGIGNLNCVVSDVIYLNGTTDYVEVAAFSNAGNWSCDAGSFFSGALVSKA